ncbi:hypothetical protein ACWGVR_06435 [Streptomyces xanthophaeus]
MSIKQHDADAYGQELARTGPALTRSHRSAVHGAPGPAALRVAAEQADEPVSVIHRPPSDA